MQTDRIVHNDCLRGPQMPLFLSKMHISHNENVYEIIFVYVCSPPGLHQVFLSLDKTFVRRVPLDLIHSFCTIFCARLFEAQMNAEYDCKNSSVSKSTTVSEIAL